MFEPLAERMRPKTLDDYVGQEHLVGKNGVLRLLVKKDALPSMIFWGPPGTGKTTLAQILAKESSRQFHMLSAINAGVKDIREVIEKASENKGLFASKPPILFVDEIHRFNKSQQDSLLAAVERGTLTLLGATTENPSFEVISALLSRCQVYILNPLDRANLDAILSRAVSNDFVLKTKTIILKETEYLMRISGGDARKLLNTFEIFINQIVASQVVVTNEVVESYIKRNTVLYDKSGDQHYDIISAFIKSIRGSDPNAAVYWLARMIEGGEDLKFIARRMLILASEDIGNANPTALVIANTAFQAVSVIGYPESRIILSQCAIYLACSQKSNASYKAIGDALSLVKQTGDLPVPLHLRNAPTTLMKELNYGKDYKYAHDYDDSFANQEFLPAPLEGTSFYHPGDNPKEQEFEAIIYKRWKGKYNHN